VIWTVTYIYIYSRTKINDHRSVYYKKHFICFYIIVCVYCFIACKALLKIRIILTSEWWALFIMFLDYNFYNHLEKNFIPME